eukprot:scaffold127482_cov41-Prasinocladus_malaysianus.AAC.2
MHGPILVVDVALDTFRFRIASPLCKSSHINSLRGSGWLDCVTSQQEPVAEHPDHPLLQPDPVPALDQSGQPAALVHLHQVVEHKGHAEVAKAVSAPVPVREAEGGLQGRHGGYQHAIDDPLAVRLQVIDLQAGCDRPEVERVVWVDLRPAGVGKLDCQGKEGVHAVVRYAWHSRHGDGCLYVVGVGQQPPQTLA